MNQAFRKSNVKDLLLREDKREIIDFLTDKLTAYGLREYANEWKRQSEENNMIIFTTKVFKTSQQGKMVKFTTNY